MRRLLLVVMLLLVARTASGATLAEARAAEERYAFGEALALYEQVPDGAARADWLRARSEGAFEPLRQLERARRAPDVNVDELVGRAERFPEGLVRVETWAFAGEAYARKGDVARATPLWRKAARDPKADPVLARAAVRAAVRAHLAAGELDEASTDLQSFDDEGAAKDVARMIRRHRLHLASIGAIALLLLAVATTRRRRVTHARAVLAFAAFVAIAGSALAAGYEGATAAPFLWFGAALVPLLLAARAWASGPRLLRAAACALSVAAAAFLVLEHTGHLEGLGL